MDDSVSPIFRFLVEIPNPTEMTLSGVVLQWDALDASGILVGSHNRPLPPIAAGTTYLYAGGAGSVNLSGTPASVRVTVVDDGSYVQSSAPAAFAVSEVALTASQYSFESYGVDAIVTTGSAPISTAEISFVAVARDADGAIVAASFLSPLNLPPVLPPGTAFRIAESFPVVNAEPATVELFATPTK